ncbi:F-type H+-transporting ATPase subunit a [Kineococcus xinjiangensis]|uniref:ATP synthase subunit a n=1 Tax=Kineococcus xinjiangensis TaxID=512762 RepID=A0A2S6IWF4_9ACTN|nr:F0F1 ATP synthase subunit A [Kineococcus xinjiangensis]PPK98663.1 F-type H+-transporting ATPase subunit a [Kineococcus xinjiangensis]
MSLRVLAAAGETFEAPSAETFWQPLIGSGAFAITRPAIVYALSVVLIAAVLLWATKRLAVVPGKRQMTVEAVYGLVRNGLARDIIGSHDFLKFVPLLFSLFTLILVNNLFGIIPPIQYPTMSRIAFPLALTLFVFVVYHFVGIKRKGLGGYFKSMVPAGLPTWIVPLVFLLELLTFFVTRPVTLALRLFGNMFAGHIILVLFILGAEYMLLHGGIALKLVSIPTFLMAFVLTVFELLVEFLQAYVFTMLAATYIAGSLADEH